MDEEWEVSENIHNDLAESEVETETNHDFFTDDVLIDQETTQKHYDPVIAAMKQEEEDYMEDENNRDTQEDDIEHNIEDNVEIIQEQLLEQIQGEKMQEEQIIQEEAPVPTMVERTIEVIDIDLDGDGIIDETIIVQTTSTAPSDIAETKRQKSLEMMQFELRNLKDKGQASSYEKKLIEARATHPDRNDFTMMLADHYYDQWEQKKALGLYRALVSADSTDDKSLSMVANCYIKLGEWENAQVILEKLVQDKPENPRYRMSLAEVYYNNKETDKTIDCVRTMVKLRPTNADYLSTLAQLYHESAYYDLYVQILYRMLELDPLNHEIKAEIEKYA
jgi:tetratricopeptide (TPR) repeat protein